MLLLFATIALGIGIGGSLFFVKNYVEEIEYIEHILLKHRIARAITIGVKI